MTVLNFSKESGSYNLQQIQIDAIYSKIKELETLKVFLVLNGSPQSEINDRFDILLICKDEKQADIFIKRMIRDNNKCLYVKSQYINKDRLYKEFSLCAKETIGMAQSEIHNFS